MILRSLANQSVQSLKSQEDARNQVEGQMVIHSNGLSTRAIFAEWVDLLLKLINRDHHEHFCVNISCHFKTGRRSDWNPNREVWNRDISCPIQALSSALWSKILQESLTVWSGRLKALEFVLKNGSILTQVFGGNTIHQEHSKQSGKHEISIEFAKQPPNLETRYEIRINRSPVRFRTLSVWIAIESSFSDTTNLCE